LKNFLLHIILLWSYSIWSQTIHTSYQAGYKSLIKISLDELAELKNSSDYYYSVDSISSNLDSAFIFQNSIIDSCLLVFDTLETIPCRLKQINEILDYKLSVLNNSGYALARINIKKSIHIDSIHTDLNKGNKYFLDSITTTESIISAGFLEQALQIRQDDLYKLDKIKEIKKKVASIPFLKLNNDPILYFYDELFKIKLDLVKIGVNQFNGIVGLVPDNSNPEITKYKLNGNLNLVLNNVFKRGESFNFKWNRASESIQTLNTSIDLPYLLNSPYSTGASLNFLQKDSSFLNVDYSFSAAYQPSFNQTISAFYNKKISTTITTSSGSQSSQSNFYGLSFNFFKFNNVFMPTKGWLVSSKWSIGEKQIQSNSTSDSTLISLHNDGQSEINLLVPVKSSILQFEFQLDKYWELRPRVILFQELKSKGLINPYLFQNDMLLIGGINSIRGIDNSSVSASQYYINRNEVRFHLERYSFLSVFFDYTEIIQDEIGNFERNRLFSSGVGSQISSKAGVFSLYYALSKQNDQAIFFRDAKIHIGFKNHF
jgi:hypothetical protein